MNSLAFYIIFIVIIGISAYTYLGFIPSFFTYLATRRLVSPSNDRRQALENLIKAPILGQFFYVDLITDYVSKNEWENVRNISNIAIQSPATQSSFPIWYYKATAQCLLNNSQQCERSARIANSLAPHGHDDHVSQLFNLAKVMKQRKNIKLVNKKDQILIVIDNDEEKLQQAQNKNLDSQSQKLQFNKQQDISSQKITNTQVPKQINLGEL